MFGRKEARLFYLLVLAVLLAAVTVSGCLPPEVPMSDLPVLRNDLEGGKLVLRSAVPGESFTFVREYSTDYNTKEWRITDSKSLTMRAWVEGAEGKIVLVEHVHVDIALKSRYEALDGWPQDEMDDKMHVGYQPGFWITGKYPYENIFAIEGFSQTLISGWAFFVGGYGAGGISETRLTEASLVKYGKVYANKVQVVYDLLIKSIDEPYFHTRSIIDEFLVPVASLPAVTPKSNR